MVLWFFAWHTSDACVSWLTIITQLSPSVTNYNYLLVYLPSDENVFDSVRSFVQELFMFTRVYADAYVNKSFYITALQLCSKSG